MAEVQVDMEEELEVDIVLVSHRDLEGPSDDLYHLMLLRISTYRMCFPHTHSFFAFQIKWETYRMMVENHLCLDDSPQVAV